jgi:hypothetical protein
MFHEATELLLTPAGTEMSPYDSGPSSNIISILAKEAPS